MKLYEAAKILDMDPYVVYVVIMKIRVWISDDFEVTMGHEPHWYLKDFSLPSLEVFSLVDAPPEPIVPYPSPPTLLVEGSQSTPVDDVIDLTSDAEDEE
ncbi:hypothetical protein CJ030_MR1G014921 [Morella rubra]|uniref:Uncharacterized protein n=1 Tax=Morella rubra TaxID=262757 RepID=A0A6A1WTG1_9ROSI|nr:hypothetical protein CJ030_MR1G014921 [Morella rubra]